MSQIYAEESHPGEDLILSFGEDLVSVSVDFGQATLLTVQEGLNIIPRTINLIPFIDIGELKFFPAESQEVDTTRLEGSLINAFTATAGSPAAGPIAAVAFNVFVLLYIPCVSAISAMRQEFGRRWMWVQITYTLAIAWGAAVLVFQVGKILFL
jgi:ferrous iron transport protein B